MSRLWKAAGVLLLVQVTLVLAYIHLKKGKTGEGGLLGSPDGDPSAVTMRLPEIEVTVRDGSTKPILSGSRPTLVHFWATWCLPCRDELPGILALDGHQVSVVAVALDPEWESVERFFRDEVPPQIVLGDADRVRSAFGVTALPVTFLSSDGEKLKLRFDGARDWTSESFVREWISRVPND